jgi:hypothetical protein
VLAGRFVFCTAWLAAWLSEKTCICAGDSPNTVDLPEKHVPPGYLLDLCLSSLHRWLTMDGRETPLELVGAIGWSSVSPSVRWERRCGWAWAPWAG